MSEKECPLKTAALVVNSELINKLSAANLKQMLKCDFDCAWQTEGECSIKSLVDAAKRLGEVLNGLR